MCYVGMSCECVSCVWHVRVSVMCECVSRAWGHVTCTGACHVAGGVSRVNAEFFVDVFTCEWV